MVPATDLHPTNASKVLSLMNKLNKSKATGLYRIVPARLIPECADLNCVVIFAIFLINLLVRVNSQKIGKRLARVKPLFRQGDRDDVNNYCPMSVIPVVVKVFERIGLRTIVCHSGFRAIHSTVAALLEATDSWAYNIDIGNINAVIFHANSVSQWFLVSKF